MIKNLNFGNYFCGKENVKSFHFYHCEINFNQCLGKYYRLFPYLPERSQAFMCSWNRHFRGFLQMYCMVMYAWCNNTKERWFVVTEKKKKNDQFMFCYLVERMLSMISFFSCSGLILF